MGPAVASVVIPAHNEQQLISSCLTAVAASSSAADLEVVVAANGCSDRTVEIARGFADRLPRLVVLDLPDPGKSAALNAGDAACEALPRIYLDADIDLPAPTLDNLVETLRGDRAIVAAPSVDFDLEGASRPVRDFYDVFARLPYATEAMVGLGVYGVSAAGRARWSSFPDLLGDDLYVQRLFTPAERLTSPGTFTVRTPRTLADLVRVRTRIARGNEQLATHQPDEVTDADTTTTSTLRSLVTLAASRPRLAPKAAVYVGVTAVARSRAGRETTWLRDQSSRATTTDDRPATLAVAYLVSQYPWPSHVFVEREIVGLRERGVEVTTFSVRPTPDEQLLSELMRAEARETSVLLDSRGRVLRALLRVALRHPGALLSTAALAARTGERRLRGRVWQLFYLVEACRLHVELARRNLRHVHVHFANNGSDIARLAVALGQAIDGPDAGWRWTLSMHGPTEFESVDRHDLPAKIRSAARVACISDFTRSQLMRMAPTEIWPHFELVRMSVDVQRFAPPAPREHDGPLRVLFLGRLVPEKGPSVLLDALEQLAASGRDFQARIVGSGPLADPLRAEVAAHGLQDRVTLPGAVGQDHIVDLYHWADIFCLPSFQEGLPVVLMEAMATGLPVVTTPIAGIPELVVEGRTGRLVAPGRADLLAEAIAELADDPTLRADLGRRGRTAVVERHSVEVTSAAQERFLRG